MNRWMKIKLAVAVLPLAVFGFAATAKHAAHQSNSNINRVVQQKDLTHESLNKSLLEPQGGGICNGCVVKFIDMWTWFPFQFR